MGDNKISLYKFIDKSNSAFIGEFNGFTFIGGGCYDFRLNFPLDVQLDVKQNDNIKDQSIYDRAPFHPRFGIPSITNRNYIYVQAGRRRSILGEHICVSLTSYVTLSDDQVNSIIARFIHLMHNMYEAELVDVKIMAKLREDWCKIIDSRGTNKPADVTRYRVKFNYICSDQSVGDIEREQI